MPGLCSMSPRMPPLSAPATLMDTKLRTSVRERSITCALKPPKVQVPALPWSTTVVTPALTPASSAGRPKLVTHS